MLDLSDEQNSEITLIHDMVMRTHPETMIIAKGFIDSKNLLPWQAMRGTSFSFPMALALASLAILGRKNDLLVNAVSHKCFHYPSESAPVCDSEYNNATEFMFANIRAILFHNGILTEEKGPLWYHLLEINRRFANLSVQNGNNQHVLDFFETYIPR